MPVHKACIIGAGSSGIAVAKILHERGIPFDCFERSEGVGGMWRYANEDSSAYQSLHINTSRDKMAYSDFPMPAHYPDFPHHSLILQYFEAYVEHFGFREKISFQTEVRQVAPAAGGVYEVTLSHLATGETHTERYGAVIVANGHHWDPNWPDLPGAFEGESMHSHFYRTPEGLAGQRVLVVGVGNSACDIACEAARVAERCYLSTRRGAHVVPKYILGRPLDAWVTPLSSRLPMGLQRLAFSTLLWLARGAQRGYGFPTPDYPFGAEHPTVSSDLLDLVGHGRILVKPDVERLQGNRVAFADGSEEAIDTIIYATGYNVTFPFFDDDFIRAEENELPLFRHVVPPALPNLYFLGLIQPLGAVMPLAEAQARWIADLLEGNAGLPDETAMRQAIDEETAQIWKRFVKSRRHTMEVDFYPYLRRIEKERKQGRRRAPNRALPAQDFVRTGERVDV